MKKNELFILSIFIVSLCLPIMVSAQGDAAKSTSVITNETLRLKGTQYLGLNDFIGFKFTSQSNDGDKVGNNTWYGVQSSYGYNIADNWNVHGYLGYDHDGFSPDPGSGSDVENEFSAGIGAWYIYSLGDKNLFVGGTVGGGSYSSSDDTDEFNEFDTEFDSNIFKYQLGVKYPILLEYGNSIALYANYTNETETFDEQDDSFGGINFGFGTYNFNTSDRFDVCHKGSGSEYSDGQYKKGDILLMGTNMLNAQIGKNTNSFESGGDTFTSEDALTEILLDLCGQYYVIDGLAAQVGLDYSLSKQSDKDSDNSNSDSFFQINIGAVKHIDAICPSFYGFGEVAFGSMGFTNIDSQGNEQSDSEGTFAVQLGIGDYYFIAPGLALNAELFYTTASEGDPTLRNSGIAGKIGFTINPGWKY